MKEFLKYLVTRPSKIAYLMLVFLFFFLVDTVCYYGIEDSDCKPMLLAIVISFNVVVFSAAMYHPYKEWKDGIR
jgi:hypothetical protein